MPNETCTINRVPQWLNNTVKQFIENAIVSGDAALPFHYPPIQQLDSFQIGFRQHGISGKSLVSTKSGDWQPSWYVVARNQFDDPFFIDANEMLQNFPVYYAPIGAGQWTALQVAPNIERLSQLLLALHNFADDELAAQFIEVEMDSPNELWQEVIKSRRNRQNLADELAQSDTPYNADDWQTGVLILTDAGPQKIKVAQVVKQMLNLTPQQALTLLEKQEITLAEDYFINCRRTQNLLLDLGASVIFRTIKTD